MAVFVIDFDILKPFVRILSEKILLNHQRPLAFIEDDHFFLFGGVAEPFVSKNLVDRGPVFWVALEHAFYEGLALVAYLFFVDYQVFFGVGDLFFYFTHCDATERQDSMHHCI